jgi:hypothetical protein
LGVRLSADSSKKTRQALRRWAFPYFGPTLLDPPVDDVLVTLGRATGRALHAPAQPVAQQRPHMRRMMTDPGQPLNDQRDAVQAPQLPDEPVGGGAFQQGLLDGDELDIRQP